MKIKAFICALSAAVLMTSAALPVYADDFIKEGLDLEETEVDGYTVYTTSEETQEDSEAWLIPEEYYETRTMPDTCLKPRLVDAANLLSDSEESALLSKLDSLSEKYSMDIVVLTNNSLGFRTATEYADDYYDYNGFRDDGILFFISMNDRSWAISTKGEGIPDFTDYGQELMMNEIKPMLSSGDYDGAFMKYADLCDDYINEARTDKPYDINHKPKGPFRIIWVAGSFVIGAIVALIYCSATKSQLMSVGMLRDADDHFVKDSFRLTQQKDTFLYQKTSKTYIQPDSDRSGGGGGSSSHTSSSGSSHGGSSGHF